MANWKHRIKPGMGGSRCGRGRSEKTEVLKHESKSIRRQQAKAEAQEQLEEAMEDLDENQKPEA